MKNYIVTISICLLTIKSMGASDFEFGLLLGSPSGLSAKLWNNQRTAFDFCLGWSNYDDNKFDKDKDRIHFHADYLIHRFDLISVEQGRLGLYYGIGARIVDHDSKLGVRFPLGACYNFSNVPIVIFLEFVPVVDILPKFDISPDAGIGVRYLFGNSKSSGKNKGKLKKKSEDEDDKKEKENPKVKLQW